jgi:hypothetical protein
VGQAATVGTQNRGLRFPSRLDFTLAAMKIVGIPLAYFLVALAARPLSCEGLEGDSETKRSVRTSVLGAVE